MKIQPTLMIAALIALLVTGCQRYDLSGHYTARFSNGVYGLQLVESSDHHLTGQLDTVVIDQNGKLEYASYAASGVADGKNVSLSFEQSGFLGTKLSGSGIMDGTNLSLTGSVNPGRISTVTFVRADERQYQLAVNRLIDTVNKAAARKAAVDARNAFVARQQALADDLAAKQSAFSNAGEQLVAELQRFDNEADQHLARWPNTEHIYQQITAKMDSYLSMERKLAGNDATSVKRGQIDVAIYQISLSTDQLHNNVQSLQNDFQSNISPLMAVIQKARSDCDSHSVITASPNGASVCQNIADASKPFIQKYDAFAAGLVHLEQVYETEHQRQDELKQEADRLE